MSDDNYWPEMVYNLRKALQEWERLTWVLIREGSDARTLGQIYFAVFQSVLLYGSDMWVIKPRIGRVLGVFRHRVAHSLTGRKTRHGKDRVLVNLPLEDVMA